ncbi:MAG: A/G-specific adenine glycosylase [Gemmatimonadetes bacterium]|nr:A/G-specific adenine glycosylase [Gemmatimonadota bacterium]
MSPARAPRPDERRFVARVAPERRRDFSRRLRRWFDRASRDLPWRRTRDPYRILVSELMLQQTQVDRVVGFYERFLDRFPSLEHVAAAPPTRVLEAWDGLGYYARARNLRALAVQVVAEGSPARLPEEPEALRALPGVGPYTAGAVASFAFERRAPLVDTNVERVLRRVFAPRLVPKAPRTHRLLWALAEALLPRTGRATWTHNQALMELGALVCTARVAHCERCPVRACCDTARAQGKRSRAGVAGAG